MRNFLNIHVLISHSPSCLNRDDMNMQKSAYFGGVRRVRVSSQSLKRAIRKSDLYKDYFGHPSIRTNKMDRIIPFLIEKLSSQFSEDEIRFAAESFVKSVKNTDSDSDADDIDSENEIQETGKKLAVAPWSVKEIGEICKIIQTVKTSGLTEPEKEKALKKVGKTTGKGKERRKLTEGDCLSEAINQKIQKEIKTNAENIAKALADTLDIALSGRMATSGLMTNVDGAMSVAHAITTHEVNSDIDWFTAVDDLVTEAGDMGAGHLSTQEFGAGVFYRYASLDLRLLNKNLGGVSESRLMEIASQLVHLFATVVPSAKQHTFAAYNMADLVYVSLGDLPISGANAFEAPIKRDGGYLKPSIKAFGEYIETLRRGYGLKEDAATFSLWETTLPNRQDGLADVENWLKQQAQG